MTLDRRPDPSALRRPGKFLLPGRRLIVLAQTAIQGIGKKRVATLPLRGREAIGSATRFPSASAANHPVALVRFLRLETSNLLQSQGATVMKNTPRSFESHSSGRATDGACRPNSCDTHWSTTAAADRLLQLGKLITFLVRHGGFVAAISEQLGISVRLSELALAFADAPDVFKFRALVESWPAWRIRHRLRKAAVQPRSDGSAT